MGVAAVLVVAGCATSPDQVIGGHAGHHAGTPTGGSAWSTGSRSGAVAAGRVRTYYIAADPVTWDYLPLATGSSPDARHFVATRPALKTIGFSYQKALYREYTDATFRHLKPRQPQDAYLGLLGPVIRAQVGDTIKVFFRNNASFPASVHPHGVFYTKANEGAPYDDGTPASERKDDAVPPGGSYTYTWQVPDRAGPGPMEGSSVMWMYHSHTNESADTQTGLMGPMEITRRGMAKADGSPTDVDREVFELFNVVDENKSWYLDANIHKYLRPPYPKKDDPAFVQSNLEYSINGYLFGTQPLVTLKQGSRVRWYVMAMGDQLDMHTPHWHGNTVVVNGMREDVVSLLPAQMVTADMIPDDPGTWLFHCHVNTHLDRGMTTLYRVV